MSTRSHTLHIKLFVALAIVVTTLSILPKFIHAADPDPNEYQLLTPIPCQEGVDEMGCPDGIQRTIDTTNPVNYIKILYQIIISLAVVLAVLMIVLGGVQTMSTDNISGKQEGKRRITQAMWGLLLLIISYLILYTINPNLLNLGALFSDTAPTTTTPPPKP